MLNKKQMQAVVRRIEKQKAIIAKARDELRDLISEVSDIADNCDSAIDHIESAADDLSHYL